MTSKLFIGSLSYNTSENQLQDLFEEVGTVVSAVVISDRDSGRSKGFGFVEMSTQEEANEAIEKLNGRDFDGRNITVSAARERAPRPNNNANRW